MRVNLARLVFSQSCSVFFSVVSRRLRIISLMLSFSDGDLARGLDGDRPGQVALGHGGGHLGDGAHLGGQVGGELVDVVGEVAPGPAAPGTLAWPPSLPSTPTSRATFVTWSAKVASVSIMLVDGVGERGDLALGVDRELALQVAVGDRGHDLGDAAHLAGQVGGHQVDVVGQVLPGAGDARAPAAWPPSLPSVPTSRATRVTSEAKALSWSTMVLMVFFSSRISP